MEQENTENIQLKRRIQALQSKVASLERQLHAKSKTGKRIDTKTWNDYCDRIKDTDYIASLISNGALSAFDESASNQQTLLHVASKFGNYEVVQLCLNLGADIHKKDYWKNKPLDLARQSGFYHIEQLLLFSRMKSNVGKRVADTAFDIRRQDGINENILNQLSLYTNYQRKKLFKDTMIDLMINIITKKLAFSDDLLSLCWEFASQSNPNVLSSNLWKAISKTCSEVIENGNKRDWFWLKTCVIPSTIWFKNINYQQIEKEKERKEKEAKEMDAADAKDEEKDTEKGKGKHSRRSSRRLSVSMAVRKSTKDHALRCICGTPLSLMEIAQTYGPNMSVYCDLCRKTVYTEKVWHCSYEHTSVHSGGYDLCLVCARKQKCYLYFELLQLVDTKATLQLAELKQQLDILSMENTEDWKELIEWDLPDEYSVARQDVIPNGIMAKFTYSELLAQSSSNFISHTFYDYNEYLCELILLAQMVNDDFQKSVQHIFNIDQQTNTGIIRDFDENGPTDEIEGMVRYMRGPVKLIYRAKAKAENDYSAEKFPTSACVIDLNRCSLVFDNISSLLSGLQMFANKVKYYQSGNIIGIVRDKNGFIEYVKETQYADIKLNVLIKGKKNNIVGEVQFLLQTMLNFKNKAHNLYAIQRQKEYVENSVSSILPILLDEDKQLFVAGCRGDVKALSQIMVNDNKTAKEIMKVDEKTGNSILHRICTLGNYKAYLFLKSTLSKTQFMHHLFKANDSDQKPIEYCVRYATLFIAKDVFTMPEVMQKYQSDENECFRLVFWLFAVCTDKKLREFVLGQLADALTADKICKCLSNYRMAKPEYKLGDGHWELYNYTIIGRSIHHVGTNNYKSLVSVIGEKEFVEAILFGDIWDINALENAIQHQNLDMIRYFLSFKDLKFKWAYDLNELFRLLYWTFMKSPTEEITNLLLAEIEKVDSLLKDRIPKLLSGFLRNFALTDNADSDACFPEPVKDLCFQFFGTATLAKTLDFEYEQESKWEFADNCYKYHQYGLLSEVLEKGLSTFQKFAELFSEKEVLDAIFVVNCYNLNCFEKAIDHSKNDCINYLMSVKGLRERIVNDDRLLFRTLHWIWTKYGVWTNKIVSWLDLSEDRLKELEGFKYDKDESGKFIKDAVTYFDQKLPDHIFGKQSDKPNCPARHGLEKFSTPSAGYGCDVCSQRMASASEMYGCRKCNYDVCAACYGPEEEEKGDVNCPGEHGLQQFNTPSAGYGCDVCSSSVANGAVMHGCRTCNYDVCDACFSK